MDRFASQLPTLLLALPMLRSNRNPSPSQQRKIAEFRVANSHRVFQHALKTGSNSPGELLMTLQHIRRGGLLLQIDLPQFVEQPRVLNGDDGLIGKRADQLDLLFW